MSDEILVQGPRAMPPTHPGALLREDVLPALNMSVKSLAETLGVTRQTLHRILAETRPVTPQMALRLGKFIGNGAGLWLRMQQSYDLWQAEREIHDELDRIPQCTRNLAAPSGTRR